MCDLFVLRRAYDDEQHGITRETDDHDLSAEDEAMFDHYEEIAAAEKAAQKKPSVWDEDPDAGPEE